MMAEVVWVISSIAIGVAGGFIGARIARRIPDVTWTDLYRMIRRKVAS